MTCKFKRFFIFNINNFIFNNNVTKFKTKRKMYTFWSNENFKKNVNYYSDVTLMNKKKKILFFLVELGYTNPHWRTKSSWSHVNYNAKINSIC